jgi:MFS transporter, PAT family, beta-lactamase induction signal transducer AmpG
VGGRHPALRRRKLGVSVREIAQISALCLAPASYQVLWAPIVDLGPRRKHWVVLLSGLGALCLFLACVTPIATSTRAFVALAVAAQVFTGLTGSCSGGLMATALPDGVRGRAGGWSNAGNLGGAALGAGVTMWLASRAAPPLVGAVTAALIFLPSLAVLAVHEAPRAKQRAAVLFGQMLRSFGATLRSRGGRTGILICASPVATAAAMNLFSGVGQDYRASDATITWVTGFAGGLITAAGALVGGYLCDRMPRRAAYLASGLVLAVCAYTMSRFPLEPATFVWGASAYLFVAGLCYASFSALVLEIVGQAGATASTQHALFTAAGNQAIAYTTFLLGVGADRWGGPAGMLRADALANVVGVVLVGAAMALVYRVTPSDRTL